MRVTLSVAGKFHAFYLAQQLLKRGFLERLITSYPKFEAKKSGIPPSKVRSIFIKEVLWRGWARLPRIVRGLYDPNLFICEMFDRLATRRIPPSDLFVGWASKSLYSLRRAKRMGAVTIVERGSAHVVDQNAILKEEYRLWGTPALFAEPIHPRVIARELREYEEADFISVPSLFVKRTFLERGVPERKLIHVPYGVDLSDFQQTPKEDDVFRVIYAGGMTLQKGAHYLLQAFSELRLPNAELLLVGGMSDEMRPFFEKFKGTFRWIGRVPQSELARHYSNSLVFVLNSVQDGFGMVMIQAMACGLPVIATTNTGAEDIIEEGKNGFIIPIRDVEVLKEKLLYLFKHQAACAAMGRSAKMCVARGFTWDDYGARIVAAYERVLAAKR